MQKDSTWYIRQSIHIYPNHCKSILQAQAPRGEHWPGWPAAGRDHCRTTARLSGLTGRASRTIGDETSKIIEGICSETVSFVYIIYWFCIYLQTDQMNHRIDLIVRRMLCQCMYVFIFFLQEGFVCIFIQLLLFWCGLCRPNMYRNIGFWACVWYILILF